MSATGRPDRTGLPRGRRKPGPALARGCGASLLAGLFAVIAPTPTGATAPQTEVADAGDPYFQQQTGFAFPARVGGAERHQVVRYDAGGADTGVGYQVARDGRLVAYVSVFVYPAPSTPAGGRAAACAGLFTGMKRDIATREPDARLIAESQIAAPTPLFRASGTSATFTGGSARFGGDDQPVRERADLFCYAGGKWLVAYRVTAPAAVDATAEVDSLMRALSWPEALSG